KIPGMPLIIPAPTNIRAMRSSQLKEWARRLPQLFMCGKARLMSPSVHTPATLSGVEHAAWLTRSCYKTT
ncbi:hypothetical protein TNCV_2220721, partial [Trichonephila clavipes]